MMKSNSVKALTVIGKDKPGIIARVTEQLYRYGCNLEDVSMTILEGEFVMILVVKIPRHRSGADLRHRFEISGKKWNLSFYWKDLPNRLTRGDVHGKECKTYLISAMGRDKTGIVYKISKALAKYKYNITDLNCRILGRGAKTVYTMILEVDIPRRIKPENIIKKMKILENKLKIEIQVRPAERLEL